MDERDRLQAEVDRLRVNGEAVLDAVAERDHVHALVRRLVDIDDRRMRVVIETEDVPTGVELTIPIMVEYHAVMAELRGLVGDGPVSPVPDELRAERDRLRTVVRRAQETWTRHVENYYDADADNEWLAAWDALRVLDVSGEVTDG